MKTDVKGHSKKKWLKKYKTLFLMGFALIPTSFAFQKYGPQIWVLTSFSENIQQKENFIITLMGPPGVGKGTLAENCKNHYFKNCEVLSLGDLFRKNIDEGTELGLFVRPYLLLGKLVPDKLAHEIVSGRLRKAAYEGKTVILEGYPRNNRQAKKLISLIRELKPFNYKLINIRLEASMQDCYRHVKNRFICPKCQINYLKKYRPSRRKGICDYCNSLLLRRLDDRKDVFEKRFKEYNKRKQVILKNYKRYKVPTENITFCEEGFQSYISSNFDKFKKILAKYESMDLHRMQI